MATPHGCHMTASVARSAGMRWCSRRAVLGPSAGCSSSFSWMALAAPVTTLRHQSNGGQPKIGSLFGSLKKKWEEYELHRDRMLDQEAQQEAAEQRRQRFQPLTDEEGRRGGGATDSGDVDSASSRALDEVKPIWENPYATPRSVLFVPGSKPRAMRKILSLTADCYILDLEDSVGPAAKREARENVRNFVDEVATLVRGGDCPPFRLVVRINSPERDPVNGMLDLELVGLLGMSIEGVAIPKVSLKTYDLIKEYVHPNHQLWAFFETPQAILNAPKICAQAYYRYAVMASNDLAAEMGLPGTSLQSHRHNNTNNNSTSNNTASSEDDAAASAMEAVRQLPLWHAAMQVLLSARAQHMHIMGGVFNDPTDRLGFARSVGCDRALGLDGKTLIHPAQIERTNAAWTPSEAEVQWAYRVKEALSKAQGGVATVDGVMVEQLHVRQASRLIALYNSSQVPRRTTEAMEAETVVRGVGGVDAEKGEEEDEEDGEVGGAEDNPSEGKSRRRRRGTPPSRHQPARPM